MRVYDLIDLDVTEEQLEFLVLIQRKAGPAKLSIADPETPTAFDTIMKKTSACE
jgi:hypothetical protein